MPKLGQPCKLKTTGPESGFKVPSNHCAFSAKPKPCPEKSLLAQMAGVDNPALAMRSSQALQSTSLSRGIYSLVSRCMKGS